MRGDRRYKREPLRQQFSFWHFGREGRSGWPRKLAGLKARSAALHRSHPAQQAKMRIAGLAAGDSATRLLHCHRGHFPQLLDVFSEGRTPWPSRQGGLFLGGVDPLRIGATLSLRRLRVGSRGRRLSPHRSTCPAHLGRAGLLFAATLAAGARSGPRRSQAAAGAERLSWSIYRTID